MSRRTFAPAKPRGYKPRPFVPDLEPRTEPTLDDIAQLVRGSLTRAFPMQRFVVTSHVYKDARSMNVRWTDGPSRRQVEAITGQFSGGFIGCTRSVSDEPQPMVWGN